MQNQHYSPTTPLTRQLTSTFQKPDPKLSVYTHYLIHSLITEQPRVTGVPVPNHLSPPFPAKSIYPFPPLTQHLFYAECSATILRIGKDFDAGRDWGQEEKGMTEDEMAEWHH